MHNDRRTRRAHAPLLAAEYFLDAQRAKVGASAVMLWDGTEPLCSSKAGGPSGVDAEAALRDARAGGYGQGRDVFMHPLKVSGRELVLMSVDARLPSVRRVESSLSRIFAG
ncbi:MAG: hypothetical protein JNK04_21005 [Myxococcales bacterium]|nr:hypothetical protein [Myxococcales bacterium]